MLAQFIFSGTKKFDVQMEGQNVMCIEVTGENSNILVIFNQTFAYLYDIKNNGRLIKHIPKPDMKFDIYSVASGKCFYRFFFICYMIYH